MRISVTWNDRIQCQYLSRILQTTLTLDSMAKYFNEIRLNPDLLPPGLSSNIWNVFLGSAISKVKIGRSWLVNYLFV